MNIKDLLVNIFSITNYGETHLKITIFGVKIKCPKWEYYKKRKENPYYYYRKNNIDITKIPPAEGQIRDIQLANLALLKELDYVCKENGMKYWLDFGSLLGAVRHKGFIPWDDDIDTGMLRNDYIRIIECFEKTSRNPDIYAGFVRSDKNPCQYYIKVQHKRCSKLFVDIFPYDFYGKCLSKDEQYAVTSQIKAQRKIMQRICNAKMTDLEIKAVIDEAAEKILIRENKIDNSDLVWGMDFNHNWKNWLYSYDLIFPLSDIEFEGLKFPCINDVNSYLSEVYGDYMAYPKKIGVGHTMFAKLSDEEKSVIEELKKGL